MPCGNGVVAGEARHLLDEFDLRLQIEAMRRWHHAHMRLRAAAISAPSARSGRSISAPPRRVPSSAFRRADEGDRRIPPSPGACRSSMPRATAPGAREQQLDGTVEGRLVPAGSNAALEAKDESVASPRRVPCGGWSAERRTRLEQYVPRLGRISELALPMTPATAIGDSPRRR